VTSTTGRPLTWRTAALAAHQSSIMLMR
jgi:hypothetical protein